MHSSSVRTAPASLASRAARSSGVELRRDKVDLAVPIAVYPGWWSENLQKRRGKDTPGQPRPYSSGMGLFTGLSGVASSCGLAIPEPAENRSLRGHVVRGRDCETVGTAELSAS
jgi:hypothetical protein